MIRRPRRVVATVLVVAAVGCAQPEVADMTPTLMELEASLRSVVAASGAEVGLYYRALASDGDSLALSPDLRMHAASTMKVPVMMQLFLDDQEGRRGLDEPIPVTRTFRSIVDGSSFDLPPESDSDTTFYDRVGSEAPARELIDRMITWSSNLATNILIEVAEPDRIGELMTAIGADSMSVLRGVEDIKAFEAGLSNTATARSLGAVMAAVHGSDRFSPEHREGMIEVLARQHFTEGIPTGVPAGVRVANKTGWITGINHDAALVYPGAAMPYVLVVMVRGHPDEDQGAAMTAELSRLVWEYHIGG
ncbi:MAG: serine hydrolase [Gemmatimonadota bacterium]